MLSNIATAIEVLFVLLIVLGPIFRTGEEFYAGANPAIDVPAEVVIEAESQVETEPSHDEIVAAATRCDVVALPDGRVFHEVYACCPLSCAPVFTTRELKSAIKVMGGRPIRNGSKAQLLAQYWSLVLA